MSSGVWDRIHKDPKLHQDREEGSSPDCITHVGANSGCIRATKKLGKQSFCLECPFEECLLDNHHAEIR